MASYLRVLGSLLIALGVGGSAYCWSAAMDDDAYYKALKGVEKYPGNVLYQTELKMAEPRHMLLVAGGAAAAPLGLVLGSICLGVGALLARSAGPSGDD